MTHELVYTSAPRGLRPGSVGYCTVAQTDGIPAALAERLEALSAYRHLRVGADPDANGNPVVYAHAVASAGGRTYHVLSRIADSGLDYSGRNNYLAHHVALTADDLPRGGPAAACEAWPFETAWDGTTGSLPAGRSAAGASADVGKCVRWEEATGDAGWAGVLAGATAGEPAYLVFRPDQDVLGLIAEAMTLVPPEDRWRVTFSTYFTKSGGAECQWRCVPAGSAEAKAAISARRGVVLRLDRDTPDDDPPVGGLVDAARTGVLPPRRQRPERLAEPPPARPTRVASFDPPPDDFDDTEASAEAMPVAPRARAAERPLPAPAAPSRGLGQLLLGLAMGLLLAVLAVAIVEAGTGKSPLRHAGVKGEDEKELGKKLADAEKDAKAAKEQAQAAEKLIESKDKNAIDWQKDKRDAEQQRDAARAAEDKWKKKAEAEEIAKSDAEKKRDHWKKEAEQAKKNAADPGGGRWSPLFQLKAATDRNAELERQLKIANDKLAGGDKPPPQPKGAAAPFLVGVPVELKAKEAGRRLFAVSARPDAKPELQVLGLTGGLKAKPNGAKVAITDDQLNGFRADLEFVDGAVSLTGEQLDRHPRLGLAVIRVSLAPDGEAYYYLNGDEPKTASGKLGPVGLSETDYKLTYDPFEALKLKGEWAGADQLKLVGPVKVRLSQKDKPHEDYTLAKEGDDPALVNKRADPAKTPAVKLTLQKDGKLFVEVKYPFAVKDNPTCQIMSADIIRLVPASGAKEPLRQDVVRIRP